MGDNVNHTTTYYEDAETVNQYRLPADLLCDTPKLTELNLAFGGRIPEEFFDCAPELETISIRNYGDSGRNTAARYTLDLSHLDKLETLSVPGIGERHQRKITLSDNSPLFLDRVNDITNGESPSCPQYIHGNGWKMCVSITIQPQN